MHKWPTSDGHPVRTNYYVGNPQRPMSDLLRAVEPPESRHSMVAKRTLLGLANRRNATEPDVIRRSSTGEFRPSVRPARLALTP